MIELRDVTKVYYQNNTRITVADKMSVTFDDGDFCVLFGPSGAGKSTILLMLGGMLKPTEGEILFNNKNIVNFSGREMLRYRKERVGFIFQKFYLLPYLSVYDNIMISASLSGKKISPKEIYNICEFLQIEHRLKHKPPKMSVGEQQRVALARALISNPDIILADEPTGNLDINNKEIVANALERESKKGKIVILVTHDMNLLERGNKHFEIKDGHLNKK